MTNLEENAHPHRRMRAQDRYAQEVLTYLWENAEALGETGTVTVDADGVIFHGSLHMFIKKIRDRAQAGDVVNILRESGAVRSVGHGLWELCREHVFEDEEGNPIVVDVVSYHGDRPQRINERNIIALSGRVDELEGRLNALQEIVMVLAGEEQQDVGTESNTDAEESQALTGVAEEIADSGEE
jgi:hypothetical protein